MTIFGINITLDMRNFEPMKNIGANLMKEIFKKEDERKVFNDFLQSKKRDGQIFMEDLKMRATNEIESEASELSVSQRELIDFVVSELKSGRNGQVSIYESLVRATVEALNKNFKKVHRALDSGKIRPEDFPDAYPVVHKRAVGLVEAKIKDGMDKETEKEYLTRKVLSLKLRELAHEMFYAINKLGLKDSDLIKYLGVSYELDRLRQAPTEQIGLLRNEIAKAIIDTRPLEVVHIKSLRYTYSEGKSLRILEDLEAVETPGIRGERRLYPNERIIIDRIGNFIDLLEIYGAKTHLSVIVADNDLRSLFLEGNILVSDEEVLSAERSAESYIRTLKESFLGITDDTYLLTAYLSGKGIKTEYEFEREKVLRNLQYRTSTIKEAVVESRVNYQFRHYRDMFGDKYTRSQARETTYKMIANNMALSVIFEKFGTCPLVVIDDRGEENKFIGGSNPNSRAIFLTKLKEPTIIRKV